MEVDFVSSESLERNFPFRVGIAMSFFRGTWEVAWCDHPGYRVSIVRK